MFGMSENRFGFATIARRVSLRRSAEAHPLGMFACVVAGAFVFMAIVPAASSAITQPLRAVPSDSVRSVGARDASSAPDVCRGQNWGAETVACLQQIARESGRDNPASVRLIAQNPDQGATPNIF